MVKIHTEDTEIYETTDLYFAVTLHALGKSMVGTSSDPQNHKKKVFRFTDDGTIDTIRDDYIAGNILLDPQKIWSSYRWLKNLLNSNL